MPSSNHRTAVAPPTSRPPTFPPLPRQQAQLSTGASLVSSSGMMQSSASTTTAAAAAAAVSGSVTSAVDSPVISIPEGTGITTGLSLLSEYNGASDEDSQDSQQQQQQQQQPK